MKTVLISGISRGIGRALAQKFLKEGYFVIGTCTGGQVDFKHDNLRVHKLQLSLPDSVAHCALEILSEARKIDVFINNAGVQLDEQETTVVIEKLRLTLEINLIGTIDLTERLLPSINRGGHIIQMSSSAGSLEFTGYASHYEGHYPAYKISKAALNMYTRTLAARLRNTVTVSSIHPGWVKTDMGGDEADIKPEEAAQDIFTFAESKPKSGLFWYKNEKIPW